MKKSLLGGSCGLLIACLAGCGGEVDVSLPTFSTAEFGACVLEPWSSFNVRKVAVAGTGSRRAVAPLSVAEPERPRSMSVRVQSVVGVSTEIGSWRTQPGLAAAAQSARDRLLENAKSIGLTDPEERLAKMFLDKRVVNMCVRRQGDTADIVQDENARATIGANVVGHAVVQKIDSLHQQLIDQNSANSNIQFSASELRGYVQSAHDADVVDAFSSYVDDAACRGAVSAIKVSGGSVEERRKLRREADALVIGAFLREYLRAFFSNGKFISGKLKFDDLLAQFPEMKNLPPDAKKELDAALAKLKVGTEKVGDGLVTRTGDKLVFPPISAVLSVGPKTTFTMTDVDFNAVGANFLRVVIEALFDAYSGLPATTGSTGTKVFPTDSPFAALNLPTMDQIEKAGSFRVVTPEDLTQINRIANTTEGVATALTGQIVRGVNIVSLNNEAMAKAVETTVGVTARKAADVAGWCAFASIEKKGDTDLLSTPQTPAASLRKVRISVNR